MEITENDNKGREFNVSLKITFGEINSVRISQAPI